MTSVFLDTAYVIALASRRDQYHERAGEVELALARENVHVVTTQAVLAEVGNALASPPYRRLAVRYLKALKGEPAAEIVSVSDALFQRGFALYASRADKEWGLVDCISFVVMRERGISNALTADRHFEQAGFNALLRR